MGGQISSHSPWSENAEHSDMFDMLRTPYMYLESTAAATAEYAKITLL